MPAQDYIMNAINDIISAKRNLRNAALAMLADGTMGDECLDYVEFLNNYSDEITDVEGRNICGLAKIVHDLIK